jgi:hypothetical protein
MTGICDATAAAALAGVPAVLLRLDATVFAMTLSTGFAETLAAGAAVLAPTLPAAGDCATTLLAGAGVLIGFPGILNRGSAMTERYPRHSRKSRPSARRLPDRQISPQDQQA